MVITAKISFTLFLKNVFLMGKSKILEKPALSDAVRGVAAKNKTIIHRTPQLAFVEETLYTSFIILIFISGSKWEVRLIKWDKANDELASHWLKKKKISKIKGMRANNVKKDIEALKAKKLCLWKPEKTSFAIK